jgi:hypothetical protein
VLLSALDAFNQARTLRIEGSNAAVQRIAM